MPKEDGATEQRIKEILSEHLSFPVERITAGSSLVNDLSMDSFAAIEIMFAIEAAFSVKVSQDEISQFRTVRDIIEKINGTHIG